MSYYQRKAGGTILGAVAVICIVALVSVWPWLLGTHVALKEGAAKNGTAYDLAGWIPEIAWLVLVGLAFWYVGRPSRTR